MAKYTFYSSSCTKDCSGHAAGYLWRKKHPRAAIVTKSQSFKNGAAIRDNMVAQGKNPIGIMRRDTKSGKFSSLRKG